MKKKAVFVTIFFGTILLTSTVAISLPNLLGTSFNTVANNYSLEQQDQFCGIGDAKSTKYVKEYKVPTDCTNPMAITAGADGDIWFVQSNTGGVVKFDIMSEKFTEFSNPSWPPGSTSMMWGMDYSADGSLWFTEDSYDSLWRFTPHDQSYGRLGLDANNTSPQKIQIVGGDLIYNDFARGALSIVTVTEESARILSVPSIRNGSVAGDFVVDKGRNIWYTSWVPDDRGVLVKFDYPAYTMAPKNPTTNIFEYTSIIALPEDASTINGLDLVDDKFWMADTSSSLFFSFDLMNSQFTKYVTSDPLPSTYGNATGIVKTPISGPYWIKSMDDGRIVFNEQSANRIAVMDTNTESLVEYMVPSKNPNWADCGDNDDCGLAQIFDFAIDGEKVWFTEWAENNIGVVDTTVMLPMTVEYDPESIVLEAGQSASLDLMITSQQTLDASLIMSAADDSLTATTEDYSEAFVLDSGIPELIDITISASSEAVSGTYKVLLGAQTEDVSVSKFVTVVIKDPVETMMTG